MTIETAIMLLIWLAVLAVVVLVVTYFARQAGAPPLVVQIIWGIGALIALLVLLRFSGFLHHGPGLAMLSG